MEEAARTVACLVKYQSNSRNVVVVWDVISGRTIYVTKHPVDSFAMSRKAGLVTLSKNIISFRDLGVEISSNASQSKFLSPPVLWTHEIDFLDVELEDDWGPMYLCFNDVGDRFYVQSWARTRIFEAATGIITGIVAAFEVFVAFSSTDPDVLISCKHQRRDRLQCWNAQTGAELPSLCPTEMESLTPPDGYHYTVTDQRIVFSPSGKLVASVLMLAHNNPLAFMPATYHMVVHDVHTGKIVASVPAPWYDSWILGFVGEEELVCMGENEVIRLNIATGESTALHPFRKFDYRTEDDKERFLTTFDVPSRTVLVVDAEAHPIKITGINVESKSPVFELLGPNQKCIPTRLVANLQPTTVLL